MKVILKKLKAYDIISSPSRISSIDIFRSFAIISVVFFHFNGSIPMGFLGVDLFFVISGFLIGGILTKLFNKEEPINYFKFVLQRGFKVWPSYYTFLIIGSFIAYLLYDSISPEQIIPFSDLKRYLFFYQNYTGVPFHWSFDHVWSLCVEEHFYLLLPVVFIFVQKTHNKKQVLIWLVAAIIVMGIASKYIMLFYSHSKDTNSATNNRIDGLAWGVILNFVILYKGEFVRLYKYKILFFIVGSLLLSLSIYLELVSTSIVYHKIVFHSLAPFCFALMILGLYYYDFKKIAFLRIIAYYSYNWYLWHPLFVVFILHQWGYNLWSLSIYLITSFLFAIMFTILIEEKALAKRDRVLNKLFDNKKNKNT